MLTLTGYAHVSEITRSSGRFFAVTMTTPEEMTISATLWTDGENGILRRPQENTVYHFSGHLSGPQTLELTSLVPAAESDEPAPPTIVNVTGVITGPQVIQDTVNLDFDVFVKERKMSTSVTHTLLLHGPRWDTRKKILRPGNVVHATGTLQSLNSSVVDKLWLIRYPQSSPASSPSASPRKERKPFPGCLKREVPPTELDGSEPLDLKQDTRMFKKGKGKL